MAKVEIFEPGLTEVFPDLDDFPAETVSMHQV